MRLILCNILQNIFPDKMKAAFSRSPSLIFIITVFGKKLTVPYLMQFYLAAFRLRAGGVNIADATAVGMGVCPRRQPLAAVI